MEVGAPAATANPHLRAIRAAVAELNQGDISAYLRGFTEDCLHWIPGLVDPLTIPELAEQLEVVYAAFSDLTLHEIVMFGEGDLVCAHWRMTGRQTEDFLGIAATGRQITVDTAEIYQFEPGSDLVKASWTFGDPVSLINQIA